MMIELPEAATLAGQLGETLAGRTVVEAVAGASPHKFAMFLGEPEAYGDMMRGQVVTGAAWYGGQAELEFGGLRLCFADGVNVRYLEPGAVVPAKHQLLVRFDDGSAIVCTISMYGAMWLFEEGDIDNSYYLVAREKPSPLTDEFDEAYFRGLLTGDARKVSAKAFLATQQRIPGLGNGVLQDILWQARIHPRRKMSDLSDEQTGDMYRSVKQLLADMTQAGGRSTEKDLFGNQGGYEVRMSRETVGLPCPECGTPVERQSYMGGNVYVCACQQA